MLSYAYVPALTGKGTMTSGEDPGKEPFTVHVTAPEYLVQLVALSFTLSTRRAVSLPKSKRHSMNAD